jgi:hypothetical protein
MSRSRPRPTPLRARLHPLTVASDHERVEATFAQSSAIAGLHRHLIPTMVMDVTREQVVSHGTAREEAALCWAGTVQDDIAIITTVLLFASAGDRGSVHVSPAQTGLLYAHCHARGLTLLAQVHSHPRDAFHSPVDERSPHSAECGFLSLVVPNFGACPFDSFESWAVFEQGTYETWREWEPAEKARRLRIFDSVVGIP